METMVEKIADAILVVAENKELRINMGKAARMHAQKTFLIASRTEQMNRFYAEVVGRNNG